MNRIINSDCIEGLKGLPAESVNCCVTSPPYFGLRDYGHDGQIGLEETPERFVAKMVEVFTEVRRVLKKDGTLWLNLGDSYASNTKGSGGFSEKQLSNAGSRYDARKFNHGVKEKDLMGIPWMVAFALRSSVYAGKIMNELDRVWLAAMIDGEGCFYVHRRKAGQHAGDGYMRKTDTYSVAFEVANTNLAIIEKCYRITGVGAVSCQEKDRRQPIYRWTVRCDEARQISAEIYPYLVAKQQQCRIIWSLPNSGDKAVAGWQAMKDLHAGIQTGVDFPEPKINLYKPGWYLRQDLIWSKPNPMPESVTDRCTKSHEYIFLLSKSAKYYYDHEAIKYEMLESSMQRNQSGWAGNEDRGWVEGKQNNLSKYLGSDKAKGQTLANKRSVWTVTTKPFSEAHFATFPEELIVDMIKAGCPEGGIVLDPFMGAGTTALVASKLNRDFIGFELNAEYIEIAKKRLQSELGMFNKLIA